MEGVIRPVFVLVCFISMLPPASAQGQVSRVELHVFGSQTLTDQQFLTGQKEGKAVFLFDSFTPRGIINTNNDQDQLGRLAMIVDAYRALDLLARHPRVDPQRIALMGLSRGGQATLYASVKRFQRMHGPASAAFAAYIAFYPLCNTTFLQDGDIAEKPVRIFHGADDDYVPVAPCRVYVERLKKSGRDVRLTEFAGAGHVFDWAMLKTPLRLPQAQNVRRGAASRSPPKGAWSTPRPGSPSPTRTPASSAARPSPTMPRRLRRRGPP
jgi:dienelactone hydrolase